MYTCEIMLKRLHKLLWQQNYDSMLLVQQCQDRHLGIKCGNTLEGLGTLDDKC